MLNQIYPEIQKRTTEIAALTFLIVIGSALAATQTGITGSSTEGDLVAEYRFDTGAGDTAYDTAGNNDGTISGAVWKRGVEGEALGFDGSDDYVGLSSSSNLPSNSEAFTISTWTKIPSDCSNKGGIFGYGNWGSGDQTNALRTTNSCSGIYHYFWGNDDSTGDIGINDGDWHHIAVTYDGSSTRKIFVDGQLESSDDPGTVDIQIQDVNIGVTNGNEYFNGRIDSLRIYSKELNNSQVRSLYNSGSWTIGSTEETSDSSKVLDIGFQHVQNGQVLDTSGNNNHGTINGASQIGAVECKAGRCFNFDGSDDYISAPTNNIPSGASGESLTATFWIKPDDLSEQDILYIGDEWLIDLENNGEIWIRTWGDNNGGTVDKISSDKWYHIAVTWDVGTGHKVYVNGQYWPSNYEANSDTSADTGNNLIVSDSYRSRFDGEIDELQIYNKSLSGKEIWKIYTKGRERSSHSIPQGVARYGFDSSPRVCILNQGSFSDGGWGGPSDSELKNILNSEGWNTKYVNVGDITEDGWRSCEVIVFPNSERYPAFDKSADFCGSVNGEGSEHDVYMEMKEFMRAGGMWVGTWGAGMWYGQAWDGSSWNSYTSCSQYSGDNLYKDGGGARCSDIGYSCYNAGDYHYSSSNEGVQPALPNQITSAPRSTRWANNLDYRMMQAYNSTSGNTVPDRYIGIEEVGNGYYFHPGGSYIYSSDNFNNASHSWNNLLTWYAGGGGQNIWDTAEGNSGTISGEGNAPSYSPGKIGSGMNFDGVDDYIDIGTSQKYTSKTASVTAWIKPESYSRSRIVYHSGSDSALVFHGGSLSIEYRGCGGEYNGHSYDFNYGEFYHVASVWNDSSDNYKMYVNGEEIGSGSMNGGCFSNTDGGLHIAQTHWGGDDTWFDGTIDSVKVYPYALKQQQIKQVMNNGGVSIGG